MKKVRITCNDTESINGKWVPVSKMWEVVLDYDDRVIIGNMRDQLYVEREKNESIDLTKKEVNQ